jgi:hypothetical protein
MIRTSENSGKVGGVFGVNRGSARLEEKLLPFEYLPSLG